MERTVLCYGDSNTHGTLPMADLDDAVRLGRNARWPGVMAAILGPAWHVIEEGLPGRTTVHPDPVSGLHKNGLEVLPAILESHLPLDLVVLMLGTNDLKHRFAAAAVEIAECAGRLVRAVTASFSGPGGNAPKVLLIAPPVVLEAGCLAEFFAGGAEKSARLAPFYQAEARRWGAAFLDAAPVVTSSPIDGVHFDAEQHRALGGAVADAVNAMFAGEA